MNHQDARTHYKIDPVRWAEVQARALQRGGHQSIDDGMCAMEAVSYVAGEPWSDRPGCACPVISALIRRWNDALSDDERIILLRDLVPSIVGTSSTLDIEQRRAVMAIDWLIRWYMPAWMRLAKMDEQADMLASLPELTTRTNFLDIKLALEAIRRDVKTEPVSMATWDAKVTGIVSAVWAAGAAGAAFAVGPAWAGWISWTMEAAGPVWDEDTKRELQKSVRALVIRMCEVSA